MAMTKKRMKYLLVLVLPLFFAGFFGQGAYADYMDVMNMTGLWSCFASGKMRAETKSALGDHMELDDIVSGGGTVWLPVGELGRHTINDNNVTCQQLKSISHLKHKKATS